MDGKLKWNCKDETKKKYQVSDMPIAANRLDDLTAKPKYLKSVRNLTKAKTYGYPDSHAIQKHTLEYYSVITEMDDALSRLIQAVKNLGLMKNTYIFFMSDNGWMLGEHGFTSKVLPYRHSTSVPFFIVGPGVPQGDSDKLVLNIDILPTILQLAEIDFPQNLHGRSLTPLFEKDNTTWRQSFVHEGIKGFGGIQPHLAVIEKDFRYIETYRDDSLKKLDFQELYHDSKDSLQINNLVLHPEMNSRIKRMQKVISDHKMNIIFK